MPRPNLKKLYRPPIARVIRRVVQEWLKKRRAYAGFVEDFNRFHQLSAPSSRFRFDWQECYPCLNDKTATTDFDRHYVYHLAWAARVLAANKPQLHIDISSSLHFCTILSAFMPVRFYDYRPATLELSHLSSEAADLHALPFSDKSIHSLSCMHVVEHIGLGRYGDPLDVDGDIKACHELSRVLSQDGSLLFVVPVGKPKIMFNAHRIYAYEQVISLFSALELREFALVPDNPDDGGLIYNATPEMVNAQNFGCGCFWFQRRI